MLHILWMLIKLILILLGTVLGLAVLVLLLLLFCPVRYSAEALKETSSFKETEAAVRVSWLFGGISFTFRRIQGKNTQKLCVFGIPVLSLLQKRKQKKAWNGKSRKSELFHREWQTNGAGSCLKRGFLKCVRKLAG